jgi:PilZ domain-containing protein
MGGEKRQTPRITPFVAPCHVVEGDRRYAGYVTDLSLKGARVSCEAKPPAANAWVVIEVRLGRSPSRSRLRGQVRWVGLGSGRSAHHFGLSFEGVDEEGQRALAAVLDEFRRRADLLSRGD